MPERSSSSTEPRRRQSRCPPRRAGGEDRDCSAHPGRGMVSRRMLDLDHPDTDFTLAVARADDAVLSLAKRMTLVSTSEKAALLDQALVALDEIARIARQRWSDDRKKISAIEELREGMRALAALDSSNDFL